MPAQYVRISLDDFDAFMKQHYFERIESQHGEYVYERKFMDVDAKIKVYSSISESGRARKKGGDAIRVVVFYKHADKWIPTGKNKRVHRVENWRTNLTNRIDDVRKDVHPRPCPKCGSPMLKREGKHGVFYSFYSCSMWPKTGCGGKAGTENV